MAEVRYQDATRIYPGTKAPAVDRLNLTIEDGEFLVLVGPSGSGKSTALRMLAGLEACDEGSIWIGDRDVTLVQPKDRDVAMVFQSYALYPHKSVRQNIEFPLKPRGVPREQRHRMAGDVAGQLGLGDLLDRKPRELSGGQRQRVALARAMVRRPQVFLMDEPLSNLDAKMRTQTRADLVDLHKRLGTTFVYVTHDQVEAMTMAKRVAIMDAGRLQQVGTPQDVYDRPANLFVARFIGSPPMNIFDGADAAALTAEAEKHQAVVGVRPEHLGISSDGDGLAARLRLVESLGHERLLLCETAAGSSAIVRVGADEPVPAEDADVRLVADARHLHLFDTTTTERID